MQNNYSCMEQLQFLSYVLGATQYAGKYFGAFVTFAGLLHTQQLQLNRPQN